MIRAARSGSAISGSNGNIGRRMRRWPSRTRYLTRRVLQSLVVILIVTVVVFCLLHALPGGPARGILGPQATAQQISQLNHERGLDRSLPVQYVYYLRILLHGDLGTSCTLNEAVSRLIEQRLPKTLVLTVLSALVGLALAVPLGMWQAVRRNKPVDYVITTLGFVAYSTPVYFLGLVLVLVFTQLLPWFPSQAPQGDTLGQVLAQPNALVLPVVAGAASMVAVFSRYMRAATLENLSEDYVRTAIPASTTRIIPEPEKRALAFPFQLSGGQRQRVVIAMAIANAPSLLIADEPTTALDVTVQAEILDLLRGLAADSGTGVLLVTHNMGVVADFADRVAVMLQGEVVETGPVEEVLLRPTADYTKRLLGAVPRLSLAEPASGARDRPVEHPVVDLREVSVRFGRGRRAVRALDGVSLTVRPDETVGLVGESGSGKSTAARVALGLVPPSPGSVSLFGADLGRARGRTRRALLSGVGVVLQDPVASLDARMSVGECVAEQLRVHRAGMSSAERRARVADVLEPVRLPRDLAHRGPRELSGVAASAGEPRPRADPAAAAAGRRRADERTRRQCAAVGAGGDR